MISPSIPFASVICASVQKLANTLLRKLTTTIIVQLAKQSKDIKKVVDERNRGEGEENAKEKLVARPPVHSCLI